MGNRQQRLFEEEVKDGGNFVRAANPVKRRRRRETHKVSGDEAAGINTGSHLTFLGETIIIDEEIKATGGKVSRILMGMN